MDKAPIMMETLPKYPTLSRGKDVMQFDEEVRKQLAPERPYYCVQLAPVGVRVMVTHQSGVLTAAAMASHKGDVGVCHHMPQVKGLPSLIRGLSGELRVEGTVTLDTADLDYYASMRKSTKPLRNAEEAVREILASSDELAATGLTLRFIPQRVVSCDLTGDGPNYRFNTLRWLRKHGFEYACYSFETGLAEYIKKCWNRIDKTKNDYPFDVRGVIVMVSSIYYQQMLGEDEVGVARWARVFSKGAGAKRTHVRDVRFSVDRTGMQRPELIIDPVVHAGLTITRVPMEGVAELEKKMLSEGAKIELRRSSTGEDNIRVLECGELLHPTPQHCACCGQPTTRQNGEYYCTAGMACEDQLQSAVERFICKDAFNIHELKDTHVEQLIKAGLVKWPGGLFYLGDREDEVMMALFDRDDDPRLRLFVKRVLRAIERSRTTSFSRFVYALGVPGLTKEMTDRLSLKYRDMNELLHAVHPDGHLPTEEVMALLGEQVWFNLLQWLENRDQVRMMQMLAADECAEVRWYKPKLNGLSNLPFRGVTFHYAPSKEAVEDDLTVEEVRGYVMALGGSFSYRLNKHVDIVIGAALTEKEIRTLRLQQLEVWDTTDVADAVLKYFPKEESELRRVLNV